MTHKRDLKFLAVLYSRGHFRFGNKQPLNAVAWKTKTLHLYNYVSEKKNSGVSLINHGSLWLHTLFTAPACNCCCPCVSCNARHPAKIERYTCPWRQRYASLTTWYAGSLWKFPDVLPHAETSFTNFSRTFLVLKGCITK